MQTRNVGQVFAFEALLAPVEVAPLVILKGPAGTAKTFLSMAAALEQAYNNDIYRRVLATRSNAEMEDVYKRQEADWFYWDIIEASNEHDYDKSSGTEYWTELN